MSDILAKLRDGSTYEVLIRWNNETEYDAFRKLYPRKHKFEPGAVERIPTVVPLARLTRKKLLKDVRLRDEQAQFLFSRPTPKGVDVFAWRLFGPGTSPVRVTLDGNQAVLPKELVDAGPLVFDAREKEFLSFWEPENPSSQAIVVDSGSLNIWTSAHIPDMWIYRPYPKEHLLAGELRKVWERRRVFQHVIDAPVESMQDFKKAVEIHLTRDPRQSLDVLESTTLDPHEQIAMLIATDLVSKNFASEQTSGAFHAVPWIAVVQEMNDLCSLRARPSWLVDAAELAASEHFVTSVGGFASRLLAEEHNASELIQLVEAELAKLPSSPAQLANKIDSLVNVASLDRAVLDIPSRLIAYSELLRMRTAINAVSGISELFDVLEQKEFLIGEYGDKTLYAATTTLKERALHRTEPWEMVPYISLVFMTLARMIAHEIIHPIPEVRKHSSTIAAIANNAAGLFTFDLVHAEAIALSIVHS